VVDPDRFNALEQRARDAYDAAPVSLVGRVLDANGEPVSGAEVALSGGGLDSVSVATDADGRFAFAALERRNRLVSVASDEGRPALAVAVLAVPTDVAEVVLDAFIVDANPAGTTRFLFTGDVALGRRFIDPEEISPLDEVPVPNDAALISTADPGPGSSAVFEHVAALFASVDYPVVNLESPVTDSPNNPHPTKSFVFFTLPGSLPALRDVGVGYVSLGNNHIYDYLEGGLFDTFDALDEVGIAYSGAGQDDATAFAPHRVELGGASYDLVSATSVVGDQHEIDYVAAERKGGAADLRDTAALQASVDNATIAGSVPILQLHTGTEYGQRAETEPGSFFDLALSTGAPLVIGHHPHVTQGIDATDDSLVFHSLGNFAFDQTRLETMLGLAAVVDMRNGRATTAFGVPVYLEDFRPRMIGGVLNAREVRRFGALSDSVAVYPHGGRGWIDLDDNAAVVERTATVTVAVGDNGVGIVDLRQVIEPNESLASVAGANGIDRVRVGRDLLTYGDIEDYDADGDFAEAERWDLSRDSLQVCLHRARTGIAGICSFRDSLNSSDSVLAFRHRVRFVGHAEGTPNKDISLYGYLHRENAGDVAIVARYFSSSGGRVFGEEIAFELAAGSSDWLPLVADLDVPDDQEGVSSRSSTAQPRAVRLFLRQSPPDDGVGQVAYDDLAVISWEPDNVGDGRGLVTPNDAEFLRVDGAPGEYEIEVGLRQLLPLAASRQQ